MSLFSKRTVEPRMRVMLDNDFGGDPDGLFQLAHHALSPSVEIRGIIGSMCQPGDFITSSASAAHAREEARDLLAVMGMRDRFPVIEGASSALPYPETAVPSEGVTAMIGEAMRSDTDLPLYVTCGAGLTDIASAYLLEPDIARRLTLIWIGGPGYAGRSPQPESTKLEYNLGIDIKAAQVVFNHSDIPIWQVPGDAYGQALFSYAELQLRVGSEGRTGHYLSAKIEEAIKNVGRHGLALGETYVLGDSPLVLLTALQSAFGRDTSSCAYVVRPAPRINDAGLYEENTRARAIRVYTRLDTRLMFEDFVSKLKILAAQE
jgi:purine nucleosidase